MPSTVTGSCIHCRSLIDIPTDARRSMIECRSCGQKMPAALALEYQHRLQPRGGGAWLVVGTILVLALLAAGYFYRRRLHTVFDLLVDETGGKTAATVSVVAAVLGLIFLILWLCVPILLY